MSDYYKAESDSRIDANSQSHAAKAETLNWQTLAQQRSLADASAPGGQCTLQFWIFDDLGVIDDANAEQRALELEVVGQVDQPAPG